MSNLKKKILLFAPELEKVEYRGISFYTVSLINSLFDAGAEIWLVTSFNPKNLNIKNYSRNSRNYIYIYEILQNFYNGNNFDLNINNFSTNKIILKVIYNLFNKSRLILYLINIFNAIVESNTYKRNNVMPIKFNYKLDNPYLKFERLLFMNKISGFISMPNISNLLKYRSLLPIKNKIKIDLDDFDLFITSEPLNLISNKTPLFQTIHDLIPLEFNPNIFYSKSFYTKLKSCEKSKRIFVSEVTKNKFEHLINNKICSGNSEINYFNENVLIQPPSLTFDKSKSINNYTNILNSISFDNNNLNYKKKSNRKNTKVLNKVNNKLKPFNYFLFNASVDKRKNVLLLIESFINSEA